MRLLLPFLAFVLIPEAAAVAQPFSVHTFAGAPARPASGPATGVILNHPTGLDLDPDGNLYVLDSWNSSLFTIAPDGRVGPAYISWPGYDLKRRSNGAIYVGGSGYIMSNGGFGLFPVAGGYLHEGQVGEVYGLAFDSAGNLFFTDVSAAGHRIGQLSADGTIRTVADANDGTFNRPLGLAIDASGALYVADSVNRRIAKIVAGNVTTLATIEGTPQGLSLDSRGNLYITDIETHRLLRLSPDGAVTTVAGNSDPYGPAADGPALASSLRFPRNVVAAPDGSVYISDETHRVRRLADGRLTTIAGRLRFAGDNGPALDALFDQPSALALDGAGNAYIADSANYRIRKVNAAGVISTIAGTGRPGSPADGAALASADLPFIRSLAIDSKGAIYIVSDTRVYKAVDGVIRTYAAFPSITGFARNAAGDIWIAVPNGIRLIPAATGQPSTLALSEPVNPTHLAVDHAGNLYASDPDHFSVRRIDPSGKVTTVVGNGTAGYLPDSGSVPATDPFVAPGALTVDSAGNLYIGTGASIPVRVSGGMRSILNIPNRFYSTALIADANDDILAVDGVLGAIHKIVRNPPVALTIFSGNGQSRPAGHQLTDPLRVVVMGRAGDGVGNVSVKFSVKSGAASLSPAEVVTDYNGSASVTVTLGAVAGAVVITATVPDLPPVEFNATALGCSGPMPTIASVRSATDFGGMETFATASWLEIKGSNLPGLTREWTLADFNDGVAPTTLEGVSVEIHGHLGFLRYISPDQINVEAPADGWTGKVDISVIRGGCVSAPVSAEKVAAAPGLLAPASFQVNGRSYLVAQTPDGAYVGRPDHPVHPGDRITLYGIGFAEVVPATRPGAATWYPTTVPNLSILFGQTPATIEYGGLAPDAIGLYQFNLIVPDVEGDLPVTAAVRSVFQSVLTSPPAYLSVRR